MAMLPVYVVHPAMAVASPPLSTVAVALVLHEEAAVEDALAVYESGEERRRAVGGAGGCQGRQSEPEERRHCGRRGGGR